MRDQELGHVADQADRDEIRLGVERHLMPQRRLIVWFGVVTSTV
jgi:hypothetical protein